MHHYDADERRDLCALFRELGPDAPTLCEGWTTFDLALHLVVRERSPQASLGILGGDRFAGLLRSATENYRAKGYEAVVDLVASGPPPWMALPGVREAVNLIEFFVHHEDVRRANGLEPRVLDPGLDARLWKRLTALKVLIGRQVKRAGLDVVTLDGRRATVRRSMPLAVLQGEVGELVLYLYGRRSAARVDLLGPPAAVDAVASAPLGL